MRGLKVLRGLKIRKMRGLKKVGPWNEGLPLKTLSPTFLGPLISKSLEHKRPHFFKPPHFSILNPLKTLRPLILWSNFKTPQNVKAPHFLKPLISRAHFFKAPHFANFKTPQNFKTPHFLQPLILWSNFKTPQNFKAPHFLKPLIWGAIWESFAT